MVKSTGITELVIASGVLSILSVGFFGAFGAMVHYLYTTVRSDATYSFKQMLVYFIMGFFVALLVNALLHDFFGRSYEGLLLLSGFLVLRILEFLDVSGLGIVLKRVGINIKK